MKSCSTNDRLVNWLYVTHALPCCSGQVQKVNSSCACATFIGLRKETVSHLANDELNHRFRTLQDTVFTLTKRHERKMTSFYATKIYHGCSLVLLVDMKIKPFLVNGWIDPLFLCGFVNVFFQEKWRHFKPKKLVDGSAHCFLTMDEKETKENQTKPTQSQLCLSVISTLWMPRCSS